MLPILTLCAILLYRIMNDDDDDDDDDDRTINYLNSSLTLKCELSPATRSRLEMNKL